MFEIGWSEILVIAVVTILVVGPKDLPRMLRTVGRYMGKLRKMAGEFRGQFDQAMRDAELGELQDTVRDLKKLNPMRDAEKAINDSVEQLKDIPRSIDKAKASGEAPPAGTPLAPPASAPVMQAERLADKLGQKADNDTSATAPRKSVAERAADAWKKAAGDDSGA